MFEEKREELVRSLKRRDYLKTPKIIEAFRKVPREKFLSSKVREDAYADRPLPIGEGQTISAPSMIAIMLEVLQAEDEDKILEIGTGSGYNAALLAEIVKPNGNVITIERLESIAETGRKNLENLGFSNVEVVVGDGTMGYEEEAPYDGIFVTACAPKISDSMTDQLSIGGKLVIPVGSSYMSQTLFSVEKLSESEFEKNRHGGCAFVPLVGENGWDEGEAGY